MTDRTHPHPSRCSRNRASRDPRDSSRDRVCPHPPEEKAHPAVAAAAAAATDGWRRALDQVYVHSCARMEELPDGVVDLTVTSPPYWNAIDYDSHVADARDNYRPRHGVDYTAYLDFLRACFAEVFRVHREGSFCAVVVGTVLLDGEHVPLPYHLAPLMEGIGWRFHQDIVWSKCTGGVKRAGSTIRNPFPGYYYPNLMIEYILIFRKPGERKIYRGRGHAEKEASRVVIDSVFTRDVANNVWHVAPVPPGQLEHPCPFPEELAYRLVRWYSYAGDVVLDPFCGVGTTPKVAAQTGRQWVGYEIKEQYAAATRERVKEPLRLRKQLIVSLERVGYGERVERKSAKRAPFPRRRREKKAGATGEDLFEKESRSG